MATGGQACAQKRVRNTDSSVLEDVKSAQEHRKHAEVMVGSAVADNAGKLPDNTIMETLHGVSGVAIVRFSALGELGRFSAEGGGKF